MQKNHKNILRSLLLIVFTLSLYSCSCSKASKPTKELAPGLYLGKLTVVEGSDNSNKTVTLDVTLQRENSDPVSVDYVISGVNPEGRDITELAIVDDGTISTTGYDVVQGSGSITFLPSESTLKKISIQIMGDTVYEHDEVFLVTLSNSSAGVDIVTPSVEVTISNDDDVPVVSFSVDNTELIETFSGKNDSPVTSALLTLALDNVSRVDSVVRIIGSRELSVNSTRSDTKVGETAAFRIDYLIVNNNVVVGSNEAVVIPAGASELVLDLEVVDDGFSEKKEQFFLEVFAVSDVIEDNLQSKLELFISDNDTFPSVNYMPLNDTGMIELVTFDQAGIDQEIDGKIGLDADAVALTLNKSGIGRAGFDYTKIDSAGNDVAFSAQVTTSNENGQTVFNIPWDCVRDNTNGLVWEVKTRGSVGIRAETRQVYWHDPNYETNGGNAGEAGSSSCLSTLNTCNTASYVADMNRLKLCGMTGWRLPTIEELRSLIDYGVNTVSGLGAAEEDKRTVKYDTDFFAGDLFATRFIWSSTTDSSSPLRARTLRFSLVAGLAEESRLKGAADFNTIRVVNDSLTRN